MSAQYIYIKAGDILAAKKKKARETAKSKSSKKVTKDITHLRKGLQKEIKLTKTVGKSAKKNTKELELLKKELELLKKKRKTARLSEYNKFMRKHIKAGKTFKQAVALWKKQKREEAKKAKRSNRTGYNIFISIQLKQGKTMKQAIRAWNELKKPKKRRKKRKVTKKVVVKRKPRKKPKKKKFAGKKPAKKRVVRRKPKKKRTVKRIIPPKVVTRTVTKRVVERETVPLDKIRIALQSLMASTSKTVEHVSVADTDISEEEVALSMVQLYFKEVARLGYKAGLDLDKVINAYFYSLSRVRRRDEEMHRIIEAIKKSKLRKDVL